MITIQQVTDDLAQRAANYGGDIADILNLTPVDLWDSPSELQEFWAGRDLSHIYPQSTFPMMSDDWGNIISEDSSLNRARGAEVMTSDEIVDAQADAIAEADFIDSVFVDDSDEVLDFVLDLI